MLLFLKLQVKNQLFKLLIIKKEVDAGCINLTGTI